MWPNNQSENAFVGGMTGTNTSMNRMTPGEIELMARKMRAMILADALATAIVAVARAIGQLVFHGVPQVSEAEVRAAVTSAFACNSSAIRRSERSRSCSKSAR